MLSPGNHSRSIAIGVACCQSGSSSTPSTRTGAVARVTSSPPATRARTHDPHSAVISTVFNVALRASVGGACGEQDPFDVAMASAAGHVQRRAPLAAVRPHTRVYVGAMADQQSHRFLIAGGGGGDQRVLVAGDHVVHARAALEQELHDLDLLPIRRGDERIAVAEGDRKSTRLNSSHSQISYAVFCLK